MKDVYFLFSKKQLKNREEALELIKHFCKEHDLSFSLPETDNYSIARIGGEQYMINIEEINDTPEEVNWMVCCIHQTNKILSPVGGIHR